MVNFRNIVVHEKGVHICTAHTYQRNVPWLLFCDSVGICSSLYFPALHKNCRQFFIPVLEKATSTDTLQLMTNIERLHPLQLVKKLHKIPGTTGLHIPFLAERATTGLREHAELEVMNKWEEMHRTKRDGDVSESQELCWRGFQIHKGGTKHGTSIRTGSKFRGRRSEELCKALPVQCHLVTLGVISRVQGAPLSYVRQ